MFSIKNSEGKRQRIGSRISKKLVIESSDLKKGDHGYTVISTKKFIWNGIVKIISETKIDDKEFTVLFVK